MVLEWEDPDQEEEKWKRKRKEKLKNKTSKINNYISSGPIR